jgi:hypothetical protein
LGWVSAIDSEGQTIWIVDAHRDGKRFVVRADEKLTAFVQLESAISAHAKDAWQAKKELAQNRFQASSADLIILRQLSTNSGSNDDDNGGGNSDARCTSNMKARNSSHSTDRVGSTRTDNSRIRNPGSRFQWKSEHQNAARERKSIRLPPMQSREAFSYSFSLLVCVFWRGRQKNPALKGSFDA